MDEFEFELDSTLDCQVNCPRMFEKSIFSVVATPASSILIRSSSFLVVTRISVYRTNDPVKTTAAIDLINDQDGRYTHTASLVKKKKENNNNKKTSDCTC